MRQITRQAARRVRRSREAMRQLHERFLVNGFGDALQHFVEKIVGRARTPAAGLEEKIGYLAQQFTPAFGAILSRKVNKLIET
jgi:hypothetical protein